MAPGSINHKLWLICQYIVCATRGKNGSRQRDKCANNWRWMERDDGMVTELQPAKLPSLFQFEINYQLHINYTPPYITYPYVEGSVSNCTIFRGAHERNFETRRVFTSLPVFVAPGKGLT